MKAIARSVGFKLSVGRVPQGRGHLKVEKEKRLIVVPKYASQQEQRFTAAYLLGMHLLDAAPLVIRPKEAERKDEDPTAWEFAAELLMPAKLLDDELTGHAKSMGQAAITLGVPPVEAERRIRKLYAVESTHWAEARKQPEHIDATLELLLNGNTMPAPVHLLAELLGVQVRVMPLFDAGILEFSGPKSKAVITLAERDARVRQRFTLAMLLQVLLRAKPGRYVRTKAGALEPRLATNYAALASRLLVPSEVLTPVALHEYATADRRVSYQGVEELARRFKVAPQAMETALVRDKFRPERRPAHLLDVELDPAG